MTLTQTSRFADSETAGFLLSAKIKNERNHNMTKRFSKILCAFLAILMVMSILPLSVVAACSHSYTKVYTCENANMHSYKSKCTKCGTLT